jgi:hypothetical protein
MFAGQAASAGYSGRKWQLYLKMHSCVLLAFVTDKYASALTACTLGVILCRSVK